MGANRTPIDSSMTVQKAISQGGYYNTDGDWNSVITLDEYPGKLLRGRVEVLILKDGKLFMYMKDNGNYRIPGGGFDKGVLNKDQAFIETKEEAKIIIENIKYSGITYVRLYDDVWINSDKEIPYDGNYTEVYVATYKGEYEGYIRKGLSDMELTNKGKFYDLSEVENILRNDHKQALINVFGGLIKESYSDEEDMITVAHKLQNKLRELHKSDMYNCIQNVDVESDDGGFVFAYFNTSNQNEVKDVKNFLRYCSDETKKFIYDGYIEEPVTYKTGFLFIKTETKDKS